MTHWGGAALAAIAAVWLGNAAGLASVASPGPLSEGQRHGQLLGGVPSHAALGDRCDGCHASTFAADDMTSRCQSCHAAVQNRTSGGCPECHSEHLGPRPGVPQGAGSRRAHPELFEAGEM